MRPGGVLQVGNLVRPWRLPLFAVAVMSEFLRFYVEERVRRKREQGEPIAPAALANEIAADLPNYRHLKKLIKALVLEMATAMNCAEITAQLVKRRRGREPLP
jgi:hypothetical protein